MCDVIVKCTAYDRYIPQRASVQLPTRVLRDHIDVLAPFLVELVNRSLVLGVVPSVFKLSYITLLLKKADLDPADAKPYLENISAVNCCSA